ncbi:MAG: hypothetical protein ABSE22_09420 [Xanthobacteraceae bacterium]
MLLIPISPRLPGDPSDLTGTRALRRVVKLEHRLGNVESELMPSLAMLPDRNLNEEAAVRGRIGMESAMRVWKYVLAGILPFMTSATHAETIDISNDRGGVVFIYQAQWEKLAAQGVNVRISGLCLSACTVLVGYIPRKDICVTPNASLGFHSATLPMVTDQLLRIYPGDIRAWIDKNGGLTLLNILWMQAPEIYKFFRKC